MKIKKQTWIPVFTRAGYPLFIADLAVRAYVVDMKKRLPWGYRDQLVTSNKNVLTVYYSKRDSASFNKYLNSQDDKSLLDSISKIEKQLIKTKKQIASVSHLVKANASNDDLILFLDTFHRAYTDLYAIYRFPTLIDMNTKSEISSRVLKRMIAIKNNCGIFYNKTDTGVSSRFRSILSGKFNMANKFIYSMNYQELKDSLLKNNIVVDKKELIKRYNRYALVAVDKKIKLYTNISAKKIAEKIYHEKGDSLNIIKGSPVFNGMIKGNVTVVRSVAELKKKKHQSILVTPMTTVDYLPYIKGFKAIVTDEGGLACHAAIVARELKVPCVIGTKIATKVLKDGDKVEVNATKGVVKKV